MGWVLWSWFVGRGWQREGNEAGLSWRVENLREQGESRQPDRGAALEVARSCTEVEPSLTDTPYKHCRGRYFGEQSRLQHEFAE